MTIIDFIIGLTLMNAMPHFVLGVWKGRMVSGLGIGNWQNIIYGLINFVVAMSLYAYQYGLGTIAQNGIVAGALFVLVIYFLTGHFWYRLFNKG
ncbi:hypothetical protein [Aureispira anguillae]|uniref:Uncharacterized protein n=1 Tax=Aureispira anguillae TaxID=2864201 RepID=A0A915Y9G5_9BACT|nr:hypothetical protein [Aureispira anguillae]BDS09458.1 hypothetical protein AsAng_0001560 [Aureispira anguillae]